MLPRNNKIVFSVRHKIEDDWIGNIKRGKFRFLFMICFLSLFFFPAPAVAENIIIKFYQDHISAADGNRCPMTPSCSSYAAQAFDKHGPVLGWVMTCDRLIRCGRDESNLSGKIFVNGQEYINDPVVANDFWWFQKEDKE